MKNISRRNFLKGSAAMGILAAMGGAGTAIAEGSSAYTFADTVKWDAEYDVVVLGLGFAGMTAAVTAADAGAKVLIAEKMSEALAGGNQAAMTNVSFVKLFPWFILGFLALALINSAGVIPVYVSSALKQISKFLMIAALAAIGLNTSFKDMARSGIRPMLHGFIISLLVVIVAIAVEYVVGFDVITANFAGL